MGIEREADLTLFIRNLDLRVTEELLFELFLQAGPVIRTKIPKHVDGKQKTFGFVVYKNEESVPYAKELLSGARLFGRPIDVQFRTDSRYCSSPRNVQNSSSINTRNPSVQSPHRPPFQLNSSYAAPSEMLSSFPSADELQKHILMDNMRQIAMQQLQQVNGALAKRPQRHHENVGFGGTRQHNSASDRQHPYPVSNRGQRYDQVAPRHHLQGHSHHHHSDRKDFRHHNKGDNRHDRGNNCGYNDGRWRQY